jgi:hypothetical protein
MHDQEIKAENNVPNFYSRTFDTLFSRHLSQPNTFTTNNNYFTNNILYGTKNINGVDLLVLPIQNIDHDFHRSGLNE